MEAIRMHCWKTCYVNRKYDFFRRFFISAIVALLVFILFYVAMQSVLDYQFQDDYMFAFLVAVILLYPFHKLCHLLPIMRYGRYMKWEIEFYYYIFPVISMKAACPIPKKRFVCSLILPFLLINGLLIASLFLIPEHGHYIAILFSLNCGLSAFDFIYIKGLFSSPKNTLVEENEDGYDLLVDDGDDS
jgi:hypothetical protein